MDHGRAMDGVNCYGTMDGVYYYGDMDNVYCLVYCVCGGGAWMVYTI